MLCLFVCRYQSIMPSFDAHCWVVRNGKIIDPWFSYYDGVCAFRGCTTERKYKKGPKKLKDFCLRQFDNECQKNGGISFEQAVQQGRVMFGDNCCFSNAIKEIQTNGGELVVGSMGFVRPNGSVFWEYGGADYHHVKDFLPKNKPECCIQ